MLHPIQFRPKTLHSDPRVRFEDHEPCMPRKWNMKFKSTIYIKSKILKNRKNKMQGQKAQDIRTHGKMILLLSFFSVTKGERLRHFTSRESWNRCCSDASHSYLLLCRKITSCQSSGLESTSKRFVPTAIAMTMGVSELWTVNLGLSGNARRPSTLYLDWDLASHPPLWEADQNKIQCLGLRLSYWNVRS